MADYYDELAADYDWLFDDEALAHGLAINHPATARLLERTPHASLVLDAACGTGVNTAALARRGYRVWAADGSSAMAAVAAARFRTEQLEIPLVVSLWADLPAVVGERFDVVLCIGNSLVHAAGREAMIQALGGLREMVRRRTGLTGRSPHAGQPYETLDGGDGRVGALGEVDPEEVIEAGTELTSRRDHDRLAVGQFPDEVRRGDLEPGQPDE